MSRVISHCNFRANRNILMASVFFFFGLRAPEKKGMLLCVFMLPHIYFLNQLNDCHQIWCGCNQWRSCGVGVDVGRGRRPPRQNEFYK